MFDLHAAEQQSPTVSKPDYPLDISTTTLCSSLSSTNLPSKVEVIDIRSMPSSAFLQAQNDEALQHLRSDISGQHSVVKEAGWTFSLIFSIFAAVLGTSFMYGFQSGVVNAPYDVMSAFVNASFLENHGRQLEESELNTQWSLVVSLFIVGGFVGSCWFPDALAERFGRTKSLFYTSPIGALGGLLCFIAPYTGSYVPLMLGRVVVGFHSGIVMVIMPALLVELAPMHLRGACGSFNELTLVFGVMIANMVGLSQLLGTAELWQFLFLFTVVCYIVHFVLAFFAAESPRWLIDKNRDDEALKVLQKLRRGASHESIKVEFDETKAISEAEAAIATLKIWDFFKTRQLWWPLILSINLHCVQQLTGIGAVMYYASEVMTKAGLDGDTAKIANFAVSAIDVIATIISAIIVDKVGRRLLILLSLAGMGLAHVFLTVVLAIHQYHASIAGFGIFLFSFSLGAGPIPWFMTAEMFAQNARPMALSVCLLVNWLTNLAVGLLFPVMSRNLEAYAFLPFAVWAVFEFAFLFAFLPETSGISMEQVVAKFEPDQPIFQIGRRRKQQAAVQYSIGQDDGIRAETVEIK